MASVSDPSFPNYPMALYQVPPWLASLSLPPHLPPPPPDPSFPNYLMALYHVPPQLASLSLAPHLPPPPLDPSFPNYPMAAVSGPSTVKHPSPFRKAQFLSPLPPLQLAALYLGDTATFPLRQRHLPPHQPGGWIISLLTPSTTPIFAHLSLSWPSHPPPDSSSPFSSFLNITRCVSPLIVSIGN
ncbi:hypothetical protein EI94DRAFT_1810303 [Lactarius quietus]|nr:hypothetical protein EI94DRAFT_1810303 [Lactarius quietus]